MRIGGTPFSDPRQLTAIDELIAESPADIGLRFGRACCLEDLGRIDDALVAYLDVLRRVPTHFGALTNLGSLLFERGRAAEARPYFVAAATLQPGDPVAQINVASSRAEDGDLAGARTAYAAALALKPDFVNAHLGLAKIDTALGDDVGAQAHLDAAYAEPKAWSFPYRGSGPPLKVLVLVSAFGGDLVTNLFFDDQLVQKAVLLADSVRGALDVPPYHVLFNAIGDADRSRPSLERARAIVAASRAAVVNQPDAVLRTGRVEMMRRLRDIPGVRAPRTERIARVDVTPEGLAEREFAFPLLLRSPGHHAGDHFVLVETPAALAGALATLPGNDVLAIEYLDARGADGDVRKYRVVSVDGVLYPVHLAIAPQWKVHYFSAEMDGRHAEEAAFLRDPQAIVGERGWRALAAICATMQLDYGGVDFGLAPDGTILVFEANAAMAVYVPAVIAAVRAMLVARARTAGYAG